MQFVGAAEPLTASGLRQAADILSAGSAELWAVVTVETAGCGFLPDRRPVVLFERHEFRRRTSGHFDATHPEISGPAGGYGAAGAHQHDRLAIAMSCDRRAALESASWGLGQIMGYNAGHAGFADAEAMCAAMMEGEDAQLTGAARFMRDAGLHLLLQRHDWAGFARRYNGAGYAANDYDSKLGRAYAQFSTLGVPDLRFRAAQLLLSYRGVELGPIDGLPGPRSFAAIRAFRRDSGLPDDARVDDALLEALRLAPATAADHRMSVDIALVQMLLAACDAESVVADGIDGPRTRNAVRYFRARSGLPAGEAIDAALFEALRDEAVSRVQTRAAVLLAQQTLAREGFDPGERDGLWGPRTATAMRAAGIIVGERLDREAMRALLAWARVAKGVSRALEVVP